MEGPSDNTLDEALTDVRHCATSLAHISKTAMSMPDSGRGIRRQPIATHGSSNASFRHQGSSMQNTDIAVMATITTVIAVVNRLFDTMDYLFGLRRMRLMYGCDSP